MNTLDFADARKSVGIIGALQLGSVLSGLFDGESKRPTQLKMIHTD